MNMLKLLPVLLLAGTMRSGKIAADPIDGKELYQTVQHYVSLGQHRTGTPGDLATSAWLGKELTSYGFKVRYLDFHIRQFFPGDVFVAQGADTVRGFPLWWVNEQVKRSVSGPLVEGRVVRGGISIIHFPLPGRSYESTSAYLDSLADAGAAGIVVITDNASNEIQEYNTASNAKPWKVPVVLVAPKDASGLHALAERKQPVSLTIQGEFRDVTARNVYGTVGSGSEYIVVSTPISGWFTCGGERGSGLAIWLAIAKWVARQPSRYTFIFTGNSGHEHAFRGAHQFLESADAPPPGRTHLWVHLGAGAATLQYTGESGHLVRQQAVDARRRFFYSDAVASAFTSCFDSLPGEKVQENKNPGGELAYVSKKGYTRFAGITYAHPFFHVPTDDATTTSPEILASTATAFRDFIAAEIK